MSDADLSAELQSRVRAALVDNTPLVIRGGGSKAFYGRKCTGEPLDVAGHAGVVNYEPTELVITARCGTSLAELEALLYEHGQMLPFEPPHFGSGVTFGGMIAAGLSGPRRPWGGAVRDAVLGVTLLNGRGEVLKFGGQVMKNVAGYDVSRLMAGALGSLGVILEASVKVLPRPALELTLVQEADASAARERLITWSGRPLPLSASLHQGGRLYLRLSGSAAGVAAARDQIGGEVLEEAGFWRETRDHLLPFFRTGGPLWRLSLPPAAPLQDLPGETVTEWGGAQRWLRGDAPPARIRAAASLAGGHATLFRGHDGSGEVFQPLAAPLMTLHRRIKAAFDPAGLLNPGVIYEGM